MYSMYARVSCRELGYVYIFVCVCIPTDILIYIHILQ